MSEEPDSWESRELTRIVEKLDFTNKLLAELIRVFKSWKMEEE